MNDEQIMILNNDSEYQAWIGSDHLVDESMEEDGFRVTEYEEYEDGYFERLGSMVRG